MHPRIAALGWLSLVSTCSALLAFACGDEGTSVDAPYPTQAPGSSSGGPRSPSDPSGGDASGASDSGAGDGGSSLTGVPKLPDAAPLTCAWLQSNANCWRVAYDKVMSKCMQPPASQGTFSADKLTCTYGSGAIVKFASAPPVPLKAGDSVKTALYAPDAGGSGTPCFAFNSEWPDAGPVSWALAPDGKDTVEVRSDGFAAMGIYCPDGASAWTDDPQSLYTCGQPPTIAYSGTDKVRIVVYSGPGPNDAGNELEALFDCKP